MENGKLKMENGRRRARFALALALFFNFYFLILPSPQATAAVGDAVVNNSSVSDTSFLDIQPGSGVEWLVHHVFHEGAVEIYWYDGTNQFLIASPAGANYEFLGVRVTNSIRLRIKNVAGSTKRIGYDGVITK